MLLLKFLAVAQKFIVLYNEKVRVEIIAGLRKGQTEDESSYFIVRYRAYKAKADVAAAASLKRMLEQVGIEVRAAKAFPEDKEMLKTVLCKLADAEMVELVLTTGAVGFLEKHCAPDAVRETADRLLPGIPEALSL